MPKTKSKRLTPKEREFLKRYLDPDSETFGNQTRSYMSVYNSDKYASAANQATALVKKPIVAEAMERILVESDAGIADRVRALSRIYHGTERKRTEQYAVAEDGREVLRSVTVSEPSYRERIAAVDIINRVAGDYDKRKAEADVATWEYKQLVRVVFGKGRGAKGKTARGSRVGIPDVDAADVEPADGEDGPST